jgi:hypothetical protein
VPWKGSPPFLEAASSREAYAGLDYASSRIKTDNALASVNVKLSADEITFLEELYVPHLVVGFV